MLGAIILASASLSQAAPTTDFGVRVYGVPQAAARGVESAVSRVVSQGGVASWGNGSLAGAARIGAEYGRVTSTFRSAEHNRDVGGVRNSYHLLGRAIDIVPRPGVSHAAIADAYRRAGYHLVESLNEGDHSHFAFSFGGFGGGGAFPPVSYASASLHGGGRDSGRGKIDTGSLTNFKIVYAPGGR